MFTIAIAVPKVGKRPTRRQVARLLVLARHAEQALLHAQRDACPAHAIESAVAMSYARHHLPQRIQQADAWHRLVAMPAARLFAKAAER